MPVEVRVPILGESVVEATIGRWLKSAGDQVAYGDPLVELETDKVNLEITAEQDGVLQNIAHKEGDTVNVGDVIALLAESNGAAGVTQGASSPTAAAPKPNVDTPPSLTGEGGRGSANGANGKAPAAEEDDATITPIARKLAEENNVDVKLVKGTGPNGKIGKEDVAAYIASRSAAPKPVEAPKPSTPTAVAAPKTPPPPASGGVAKNEPGWVGRAEERIRMSRRRQTIATRLVDAQHTAAMLTTFNEIDMTAIMEVRKRRKDSFKERYGVGLGFMSFFTKAVVGALKAFPYLNAEIQGDEIVLKKYYDIGIAVGAEEGLVVPVVRDADRLSFAAIEKEIGSLAGKAREGKLTLAELLGGTFTITNGGIFGSLMSTPILNAPQVGILGMHKIQERPVVVGGEIVIRPMMYVALSYDHRIVDGSEAVRFLVRIKELAEDPESLLLEG